MNGIMRELPECLLLTTLATKANDRHDIGFDFIGKLNDFRQRVSQEIRFINQLFPEYTPHDEDYHINNLFHIADTVLERNLIENMNSAELLILAISLYGHDWGMAISESEKQFILSGKLPEGYKQDDLWILPNERDRIKEFAIKERLGLNAEGYIENISIELWREYVRQTHAFRSGERVRRFFQQIDGGIADSASRICEGHWLDFNELEDDKLYPYNFSILRESANLRALSIYTRLIDLLDLAEDRTPYVIWKFVAPRNPDSKMEWAKHRSLRPITCPPYQTGRIIQVDGSTDDHEVYAALEDMRIYCQAQLRGCNDILARMNDSRHKLDLYNIDWRVAAKGFKPVSIQFEFDRNRMFEILGDEIYQGDPYVFLRELLQNSIDAIKMRHEILERNEMSSGNLGVISVNVEHKDNCDAVITWTDDGIGMDEYIIRNYLSVAGKSYYRSDDFEREGLKMDPISRFGIGILSCFMVTDRIEIDTRREPYSNPTQDQYLKITIPALNRQFRIEMLPSQNTKVGTRFTVYVEGKKLPIEDGKSAPEPLRVTDYLCEIAGFVEFPIVITEGDRKTIILHPDYDVDSAKKRFGEDFEIHKISFDYPWSEVFFAQDIQIAQETLSEIRFSLSKDLGIEGYDGFITYVVPKDKSNHILIGSCSKGREVKILDPKQNTQKSIRWNSDDWLSFESESSIKGISRSCQHPSTYTVYKDGILLANASVPDSLYKLYDIDGTFNEASLPLPKLTVNILGSMVSKIDLARTQIQCRSEKWDAPIWDEFSDHICKILLKDLIELEPYERFFRLGYIIASHRIKYNSILKAFPEQNLPVLVFGSKGEVKIYELCELSKDYVYFEPDFLTMFGLIYHMTYAINAITSRLAENKEYKGIYTYWEGEEFFPINDTNTTPSAISAMHQLTDLLIHKKYSFSNVRFLTPPWNGNPPLIQTIGIPIENLGETGNTNLILEKALNDPVKLSYTELMDFIRANRIGLPNIKFFLEPFDNYFGYGFIILNLKHKITQDLIKIFSSISLTKMQRDYNKKQIGRIEDSMSDLLSSIAHFNTTCTWDKINNSLNNVMDLAQRELSLKVDNLVLCFEDFVPGSIYMENEMVCQKYIDLNELTEFKSFGKPITQIS